MRTHTERVAVSAFAKRPFFFFLPVEKAMIFFYYQRHFRQSSKKWGEGMQAIFLISEGGKKRREKVKNKYEKNGIE